MIKKDGLRLPTVTDDGIYGFFPPYRWLSNFHVATRPIFYQGIRYRSSENLYQALKTLDPALRAKVGESTPSNSKRLGSNLSVRPNWPKIRAHAMITALKSKFEDPELRDLLVNTGTLWLEESNDWGDRYWGTVNKVGLNHLGLCLMTVRASLTNATEDFVDLPDGGISYSDRVAVLKDGRLAYRVYHNGIEAYSPWVAFPVKFIPARVMDAHLAYEGD
jgi:predicted NAD-dependent protein-ADP-ribosyltransferase YbiA (DUF1768 family)